MDKKTLLRFIAGESSCEESEKVLNWADKDIRNKKCLSDLKMMYLSQYKDTQKVSEEEIRKFREELMSNSISLEKKKAITFKRLFVSTAVAAIIAAGIFIFKPYFVGENSKDKMRSVIEQEIKESCIRIALSEMPDELMNTVYTVKGVKSKVMLPDGSNVWLNSDTKIIFPNKFIGDTREVYLSGEAYFNVKSDSLRPMIINTNKNFSVKVTGTEFNIKSYDDDNQAEATLYSGSIHLITNDGEKTIHPNEQVIIYPEQKIKINSSESIETNKAWVDGKLIFEDTAMEDVIKILERWHGVEIIVKDPQVMQYTITANFKSESIPQIMYILKNCAYIDYTINDNRVTLFEKK